MTKDNKKKFIIDKTVSDEIKSSDFEKLVNYDIYDVDSGKHDSKKTVNNSRNEEIRASHIKSDNSKSYKELSFNVLEKVSRKKNSKNTVKSKNFKNRAIISSDEMLDNKKVKSNTLSSILRKNLSWIFKIFVVLLGIVLIISLISIALNFYQQTIDIEEERNNNGVKVVLNEVAQYDSDIIKLNLFLENSLNFDKVGNSDIDIDNYEHIKIELNNLCQRLIDLISQTDAQSEVYSYLGQARQSVEFRISMLNDGISIYKIAVERLSIIKNAEEYLSEIFNANNKLKESDNMLSSNNTENFVSALKCSEDALEHSKKAKNIADSLINANTKFNFSAYSTYAQLMIDTTQISINACNTLMNEDLNAITNENNKYMEASNKLTDYSTKVDFNPVNFLKSEYEINIKPLVDSYKSARVNASYLDSNLRNYFNIM